MLFIYDCDSIMVYGQIVQNTNKLNYELPVFIIFHCTNMPNMGGALNHPSTLCLDFTHTLGVDRKGWVSVPHTTPGYHYYKILYGSSILSTSLG